MDPQMKTLVMDPLIGRTLSQYRIEGFLGQGGMGVVYRARDLKLQRPVALKVLPPEQASDGDALQRFQNEAQSSARHNTPPDCGHSIHQENRCPLTRNLPCAISGWPAVLRSGRFRHSRGEWWRIDSAPGPQSPARANPLHQAVG